MNNRNKAESANRLNYMYRYGWRAYKMEDWNSETLELFAEFYHVELDEKYGILYIKDKYEN